MTAAHHVLTRSLNGQWPGRMPLKTSSVWNSFLRFLLPPPRTIPPPSYLEESHTCYSSENQQLHHTDFRTIPGTARSSPRRGHKEVFFHSTGKGKESRNIGFQKSVAWLYADTQLSRIWLKNPGDPICPHQFQISSSTSEKGQSCP